MAIPEGVETVTITTGEPITLPDGTLVRGHIRFVAPALNLIDDEDFIFGGESTAELCHGEFTITLVPPDATGITPTGWTYTAIAEFENAPGWTRYVDITKADPNVFLDDVIVLTPGDVTYPDTTFVRKAGDTMLGDLILNEDPTVPLQAATKQYVDDSFDPAQFVEITGDTMTGPLVLSGNPVVALGAAPKQYVDQAEADAVTAATAAAAAESVSLSGDTMTGPLILSGAPATGLGAATKNYVDAGDDARVAVAGDTMTGPLVLSADPVVALGAATKQFVESEAAAAQAAAEATAAAESVSLSGDTMTGALILNADPVAALGAATKQFAEAEADAAQAAAAAESVSLTGDTMTGPLVLFGDPNTALGATPKQYVDAAQAAAAAESVSITGDTMTGALVLNADPLVALGAATKQYVDQAESDAVAAATAAAAAESVSLTGDTMTGPLILSGDPAVANGAANKNYVDNLDAANVKLTGNQTINGIKTFGSIPVLPGTDPVAANEATRKAYVDTLDAQNVKITGNQNVSGIKTFANTVQMNNAANGVAAATLVGSDVFDSWQVSHRGRMGWGTGAATRDAFFERIDVGVLQATSQIRVTGAAPLNAADLTRKDYVDTLDGQNVKLTGNQTVAGVKTFSSIPVLPASSPSTANEATRKQYVDDGDDARVAVAGDTMTGFLTLNADPVDPLHAATQQYVDAQAEAAQIAAETNAAAESVSITGDTMTGPLVLYGDPAADLEATPRQYVDAKIIEELLENVGLDTGVMIGGELNVNVDPTKVDIGDTLGIVVDYITTPATPTITAVNFSATTVTISDLVSPVTWILLDSAGSVVQQTTRPTNVQRRTHLVLGGVLIAGGVIIADQSLPNYSPQTMNQLYDLMDAIGPFNVNGNVMSAASTNLTVAKTVGSVFSRGFNHFAGPTLTNDPHVSTTAAQNPMSMRYVTQVVAAPVAPVTSVDPTMYDNAGTITAVPGGANVSTIQRVYITPLNDVAQQVAIHYGQTTYASLDDAIAAIGSETFVKNANLADAVLLGYIVVKKSATNLSDTTSARIITAARFSGNAAGATESISLAVLKAGSTMTGELVLFGNPTVALGATPKQYVDGLDTANVKLTGAQTVAGVKTFSSIPVLPASDPTTANEASRKAYVDTKVSLTGAETIAGVKTFSSIPVGPASDPATGNQLTRKTYVDNLDAANVKLTGDQTVAGIKTFSSIPLGPGSDPTTANQLTRKSYVDAGDTTNANAITALDGAVVKLTGDQTVAGIKTFSSIPVGPASDPTTANQLTRKSYVDALDAANVKLTGDQTVAGIKTFSSIPVLPASDPTTTNQATRKSYVDTLDGANVKLTGAQSISGVKTFSSGVSVTAGITSFRSAIKAGATSRNTTVTPAADPDLVVAVEANSRYDVSAVVGWTNGGGGFRVDFTGPSGATMLWVDNDGSVASTIGTDLTFSVTVGTSLRGTLVTSGTAGNLTLRWAQNTSNAADTTLLAGCSLLATRIL